MAERQLEIEFPPDSVFLVTTHNSRAHLLTGELHRIGGRQVVVCSGSVFQDAGEWSNTPHEAFARAVANEQVRHDVAVKTLTTARAEKLGAPN